jgi:hypothetical protein
MTLEAARVIAGFEASVVVYLAGNAAERRALQGSALGWRRWRTPEELRAHHEAGHAIAEVARGCYPWKLSIIANRGVRIGKSGFLGGYSSAGTTPEPPGAIKLPAQMDCDLRLAARACQMLSLCEPPYGWRGAIRVAHRLQARTGDFVEQHWHLIALLAGELVRHEELEQAQIEAILRPAGLMPRRVPCVPEVRAASG